MKVRLNFDSPVVLGGRKTVSNYIDSIDYIQGNVLRAAFARYILNNCAEFDEGEAVAVDGEEKKNWVCYRDREGCRNCKIINICKKFSSLKFSYFYPEGVDILPHTAMVCKYDESHGYIDLLVQERECPVCGKGGRVEAATGYIKDNKKYNVEKMFTTKTAVDNYTRTAKEGMLYTVVAVSQTSPGRISFTGYIDGLNEDDLNNIDELRVGKYISVGYGRCTVEPLHEESMSREYIIEKMKEFDGKFKSMNFNNANAGLNYFALKLTSDAKLNINEDLSQYRTNDDYIKLWQSVLKINEKYKIHKLYCETFNFRGYDLSNCARSIREEPVIMFEKGSVILFSTKDSFDNVYDYFSNIPGLGDENENGFGDFAFYFGGVTI